ncbi:hypothetical protein AB5I41_13400 [Sphingomonas sp. MMS24-JH45]
MRSVTRSSLASSCTATPFAPESVPALSSRVAPTVVMAAPPLLAIVPALVIALLPPTVLMPPIPPATLAPAASGDGDRAGRIDEEAVAAVGCRGAGDPGRHGAVVAVGDEADRVGAEAGGAGRADRRIDRAGRGLGEDRVAALDDPFLVGDAGAGRTRRGDVEDHAPATGDGDAGMPVPAAARAGGADGGDVARRDKKDRGAVRRRRGAAVDADRAGRPATMACAPVPAVVVRVAVTAIAPVSASAAIPNASSPVVAIALLTIVIAPPSRAATRMPKPRAPAVAIVPALAMPVAPPPDWTEMPQASAPLVEIVPVLVTETGGHARPRGSCGTR